MLEWEVVDGSVHVVDANCADVWIRGRDLSIEGTGAEIPRSVDETIVLTTDELRVPHAIAYAFALGTDAQYELDPRDERLALPAGEYVVDVDADVKILLRFSGAATLVQTPDLEQVVVSFPERIRVIVGFRSHREFPTGTITVTDDPEDVAAAIGHLHAAIETTSPNRSYPTTRGHPPRIERGDEFHVPPEIRAETSTSGIEVRVPPTYEALFVTAPLAYYLGATVTLDERGPPRLRLPEVARVHRLDSLSELDRGVERLLRKAFFLDCLVRNEGPYATSLAELDLLNALDLDAGSLYEAGLQERLARYLEIPLAAIEHRLPDWPLSTYAEPEPDRIEALPFLLDRLSLIYTPRTSELDGEELVERSLDDFYRSRRVASVDVVKPELQCGRAHGWLAEGVPIDVFKTTTTAYENRLDALERATDSTSICVVLNDPEMAGEGDSVAGIYRRRAESLSIDLSVEESLSAAELARVFETDYDFVHYIGHCETDGLRCADGYLSADSLETCRSQTFFLNACGSFYEGTTLVEKGAVAGAVTSKEVLNEQAVKVGSAFAKLLVHGFSIERALRLARRRIMMGKDYIVVGDGTHSITLGEFRVPTTVTVAELEDDRYLARFDCYSPRAAGSYYFPYAEDNEHAYLCGNESHFLFDERELLRFLRESETCVIYDGDLYWSRRLWEDLRR